MQKRARLTDVAALAGVTKSVASRVLNGDPTLVVRPETRERVRVRVCQASSRLGYRPHFGALALAGSSTRALALLVLVWARRSHRGSSRARSGRLAPAGYVLLIAEDRPGQEADELFPELVTAGRVDGLLIAPRGPGTRCWPRTRR